MTCCLPLDSDNKYIDLGSPSRIWTIPSIHSDVWQLIQIHDALLSEIAPGDRIVYLGNYIGYGKTPLETIDELLTFRRMLLAVPGFVPSDIIYLKGVQEEMWDKLLQLQFAPDPFQVVSYVLDNGMESMLDALGTSAEAAVRVAREGVVATARWTNLLREKIRKRGGYEAFFNSMRRAAFTCRNDDAPLLFVNAGIDPTKNLSEQTDNFWWSGKNFNDISANYDNFHKVIRGFDPNGQGLNLNCVTATLDAGCGFGGPLIGALIDGHRGEIDNIIEI
ncbi:MAG: hypothetical protein CMH30_08055 [Micavibrio sp.]|nr:hypothetical protein [Micavibrio sp.]|tara:strand:- start:1263 stop:2093 length:831 start_codon:yes stop_codon:yes gene_type:complete